MTRIVARAASRACRTRPLVLGVALALHFLVAPSTGAQESPMARVALKDREISAIALTPEGDVLAATDQGAWRVSQDGATVAQLPTVGLPAPPEGHRIAQVVCTSQGDVFAIPGRGTDGVFRLRAGAASWQSVGKKTMFVGVAKEVATTLARLPDDTLLSTMANPSIYRGETVAGRVYRSIDAGETWDDVSPAALAGAFVRSLVAGPDRQLWAVGGPGLGNTFDPTRWVLIADDWRAARPRWRVSAIQRSPKAGAIIGEPAITGVAVDRKGVAYALVTTGHGCPPGIYRSTDAGASWVRTSDAQEINVVIATPDNHAFVGSYGGLLRSTDGGTTWSSYAGLGKTFVSSLLVDRQGRLWAGTASHGQLFPVPGLFRSTAPVGSGVAAAAGAEATPIPPSPIASGSGSGTGSADGGQGSPRGAAADDVLFDNGNAYGVESGPSAPTVFALREPAVVARITTYHWNSGRGATPGTIGLRGADGTTYGPWPTRGGVGQGGVVNAYWSCEPGIRLEPGTYTIVDSDPATWARNAPSGQLGIARVVGHAAR